MHIVSRLFCFTVLIGFLAGCGGGGRWHSEYDKTSNNPPAQLQYGTFSSGLYGTSDTHHIAVLLPLSGPNASIGKTISPAIEAAAMQYAPSELYIKFYDTGTSDVSQTIQNALSTGPEIIIGPVFADNAKILRDMKSSSIPVLSFSSDISALGDGVFSMAVMPTNTIEATIQEMESRGSNGFIVLAPDNSSGRLMAGIAQSVSQTYNIKNVGIFYYNEHDTESIKSTAMNASMYTARNSANTRAKEILSGIINNENLSQSEKYSLVRQLENLNRTDTLGKLPYDSILFLGNSDDTKSLASFLRYYGIGVRDAQFYGTPMWADGDIISDVTMIGSMFATLPEMPSEFSATYESATNKPASHMAAIGYDATMLAIGALYSQNGLTSYLMNAGGYIGANGLFRLTPNGTNERSLRIVRLNGDGTLTNVKEPASAFTIPLYKTTRNYVYSADAKSLDARGVNPMDYINIPERFRSKYRSKTYGVTKVEDQNNETFSRTTILPSNNDDFSITAENYNPIPLESVSRSYIDSVEVSE